MATSLIFSCEDSKEEKDKLSAEATFNEWSLKYIEADKPLDVYELEDFVETAITSYHPVFLKPTLTTDTFRYSIPKQESFNQSASRDFIVDLYSRIEKEIDDQFQGVDLTIWKGPEKQLVQALLFRSGTDIENRTTTSCLFEDTETYHWRNGNLANCDNGNTLDDMEYNANIRRCGINDGPDPQSSFMLPGGGTTVIYRLTPGNNGTQSSVPCNGFQQCRQINNNIPPSFDPRECISTPTADYCNLLTLNSSPYNYNLHYDEAFYDNCINGDVINDYQDNLAQFINSIPNQTPVLYGVKSSYKLHKVFLNGSQNDDLDIRAHQAEIIFWDCVPGFN